MQPCPTTRSPAASAPRRHHWLATTAAVLLTAAVSLAGDAGVNQGAAPMTFGDLLKAGATQFVDREFSLKAKFKWQHLDVGIPEAGAATGKEAGPLTVPFAGPEFKDVKGKTSLFVVATPDLVKTAGPDGREVYSFKGLALANNDKEYVLTVRLKLRAAFKKALLDNPAFVKQSNNPAYWSQTFELELLGVKE